MKQTLLSLFSFIVVTAASANATPVTINDNFVGGTPTNSGWNGQDIIGDPNEFGISKMVVDRVGNTLTVGIFSTYFDNVGAFGTEMGDLFISTNGWHPAGAAPYNTDDASNGEAWEYALVLSNHGEAAAATQTATSMLGQSGTAALYQITNNAQIILSNAPAGYIYRGNQEVQYAPGNAAAAASGTWSILNLGGSENELLFSITSSSLNVSDLGFHWAFTCGNDVIEGGAQLPEPCTMALLASALAGGLVSRRRIA